jgi:hypothetical protein
LKYDIAIVNRDIKELETTLRHEIELLRADTGRLIAESKAETIRWIIGIGLGAGLVQTSMIIGVLLKVAHLL